MNRGTRKFFCHSGGQVDNFWRTARIQGNENYLFSRGSLCWQIGMWSPNNISDDYPYNDVLRLQYMITAVKGLHQVMHGISTISMTINGIDCTGTWHYPLSLLWQVHNLIHVYTHNVENHMKVGLISCGLQCDIYVQNYKNALRF